jgi:hypothetical protein
MQTCILLKHLSSLSHALTTDDIFNLGKRRSRSLHTSYICIEACRYYIVYLNEMGALTVDLRAKWHRFFSQLSTSEMLY